MILVKSAEDTKTEQHGTKANGILSYKKRLLTTYQNNLSTVSEELPVDETATNLQTDTTPVPTQDSQPIATTVPAEDAPSPNYTSSLPPSSILSSSIDPCPPRRVYSAIEYEVSWSCFDVVCCVNSVVMLLCNGDAKVT